MPDYYPQDLLVCPCNEGCPTGKENCDDLGIPVGKYPEESWEIKQSLDENHTIRIGNCEIPLRKRTRDFKLTTKVTGVVCAAEVAQIGYIYTGSVSESYEYITSKFWFVDSRYNHAFGRTKTQKVTFNNSKPRPAKFKNIWGVEFFHKFIVENHDIETETEYFIIINGQKTILDTTTEIYHAHTETSPLVIVWPMPQSHGDFSVDFEYTGSCPNLPSFHTSRSKILQHGFYDYREPGQIERDGGSDFYWPDWCKTIGQDYNEYDKQLAADRYLVYYLNDPTAKGDYTPAAFPFPTGTEPYASIMTDKQRNIFYSILANGSPYSDLISSIQGDLGSLYPNKDTFYPIGII